MRHRHVTVTLEAATVDQIETHLESGETVSAWIAEAARQRLDPDDAGTASDESADEGPPYEFVDDCAI